MGERKVLNHYYPPDFDPAKIPRKRQSKNKRMKVRTMLSMDIRCSTCGDYINKGTKFNSMKEDVGETYLGIRILRFYVKCTNCSTEIILKTDPQNSDYIVESGATRNYELWEDEVAEKEKRKREAEEMGDVMKCLESKSLESKREMDKLAALDEVKSMKSIRETISMDAMLEALQRSAKEKVRKLEEEDEAYVKSLFGGQREVLCRINDDGLDDDVDLSQISSGNGETSNILKRRKISSNQTDSVLKTLDVSNKEEKLRGHKASAGNTKFIFKSSSVSVSVVRKQASKDRHKAAGLESLCQNYESDNESCD